jgi:spore coat protein CotH
MRAPVCPALAVIAALVCAVAAPAGAQTADELFDASTLNDVRLVLHSADWQKLKDNFQDNTYYPADLTWRGVTVRNIGIRSRGLGSRSSIKPGLRVDFDRYSSGQRFLDLKSIVLDNLTQDPSMMKEVLSMQLFARLGLPAPREAFVRLYVNNTLVGLYAVVESIDKKFLTRVFGEDNGNLYEYDYTYDYNFEYLGSDLERYKEIFDPKTNETHSASDLFGPIEDMVRTANEASDATFESSIGRHVDLAAFARHVAAENFVAENDGWLGYAGMNNFYLYRFKDRAQFQVVTWDKDNTFFQPDYPIFERVDRNVLMRRAMALPAVKQAYLDGLTAAAASAADGQAGDDTATGWLGREIERLSALIASAARQDTNKPYSDADVDTAVAGLQSFARTRGAFVTCSIANLSRTPVSCTQ